MRSQNKIESRVKIVTKSQHVNFTKEREEFVLRRNLSSPCQKLRKLYTQEWVFGLWQFSCYINNCNSSGLLLQVSLKGQPTPPYPSCSH